MELHSGTVFSPIQLKLWIIKIMNPFYREYQIYSESSFVFTLSHTNPLDSSLFPFLLSSVYFLLQSWTEFLELNIILGKLQIMLFCI